MTEDDVKKRAVALATAILDEWRAGDAVRSDELEDIIERHLHDHETACVEKWKQQVLQTRGDRVLRRLENERDELRAIVRDITNSHTTIADGLMIRVVVDATVMDRAIRALGDEK